MDIGKLLLFLSNKKIHISILGEKLKIEDENNVLNSRILNVIKKEKDKIIDFLKQNNNINNFIPKVLQQNSYSVSNGQKRIWLECQYMGAAVTYNIPMKYEIKFVIDVEIMKKALIELVSRHESLRTIFKFDKSGDLRQWVLNSIDINLDYLDLTCTKNDIDNIVNDYIHSDKLLSFNLETGPLLRIVLFKVSEKKSILYYNIHHIIADAYSLDIIIRDFMSYYHAINSNTKCSLPNLSIQYKDYTDWFLKWLNSEDAKLQRHFWMCYFEGELQRIELPFANKNRSLQRAFDGKVLSAYIKPDLYATFKRICLENNCSIFVGLLSCINILFYRYTYINDIIVGTPMTGRFCEQLENQIGFYLNTVGIRNQLNASENFVSFLNKVKQNFFKILDNKMYPFDCLIEDLRLPVDKSRSPLFDIMITHQTNSEVVVSETMDFDQIVLLEERACKYDLLFMFFERKDHIYIELEYKSSIYNFSPLKKMMKNFNTLLQEITSNPEEAIEKYDFRTKVEKEALESFQSGKRIELNQESVIESFYKNQRHYQDKICLKFGNEIYTYMDVNKITNQIANYLICNYKIAPDDIVAIKIEKSDWFILCILGILKSGAAFLSLDSTYPKERLEYMIGNSCSKLVIDENELMKIKNEFFQYSSQDLLLHISKEDLSYIIYTSGTTGNPKGIMMNHQALINLIDVQVKLYKPEAILQFAALSFDVFVQEIFTSLLSGATLHIVSDVIKKDPSLLIKYIVDHGVDNIFLPTAFFKIVSEDVFFIEKLLKVVKVICVAGEQLTLSDLFIEKYINSNAILYNQYGPAETHVVTTYMVSHNKTNELKPSIGRPIQNVNIYILDDKLQEVPIGIEGEIYISGVSLAHGYLNNEELTKQKFIYNFGERLYKTGDIAKWQEDGNIEFIGRKDTQIKVDGFRIELSEIENVMLSHPYIKDVAIICDYCKKNKTSVLIVYYVPSGKLMVSDILFYLKKRMPAYMIPKRFVEIAKIPLTQNGKLDKRKLADIKPITEEKEEGKYLAKNKEEEEILNIIKDVLDVMDVGLYDDFLSLGGNSLKAIKLIAEIDAKLSKRLYFEDIINNSTLEELISHIRYLPFNKKVTVIPVVSKKEYYETSSSQKRFFFAQLLDPDSVSYNLTYAYELRGCLDVGKLKKCFEMMIQKHESLRTCFLIKGGNVKQKIMDNIDFDIDCSTSQITSVLIRDYIKPFILTDTPLFRISIIKDKTDLLKRICIMDFHHIICDGISIGIFMRELWELYSGRKIKKMALQYKDYSEWQMNNLFSNGFNVEKQYWLDKYKIIPPQMDLPYDYERPDILTNKGASVKFSYNAETTLNMINFASRHGVTLYILFFSAYILLLSKMSFQLKGVVGTPVSGRRISSLESIIGVFINVLPINFDISNISSVEELLIYVKRICLEAFENQEYPFERIIEDLNITRSTNRTPLFDVMFDFHNELEEIEDFNIDDIKITQYHYLNEIALYDLNLHVWSFNDVIHLRLDYKSELFSEESCRKYLDYYVSILDMFIKSKELSIDDIEIGIFSNSEISHIKQDIVFNFSNNK